MKSPLVPRIPVADRYPAQRHTELRKMADRIQARAIQRMGELLKQVPAENEADHLGAPLRP